MAEHLVPQLVANFERSFVQLRALIAADAPVEAALAG
jgi:hypothetical protein